MKTDARKYKVAVMVVLTGDDEYKRIFDKCLYTIQEYCDIHGYEYFKFENKFYENRPAAWSRIGYLEKIFIQRPDISHILYIDADAMITNNKFRIEQLIDVLEKKSKCILFTIDSENNLNDGVAIYKNCDDTITILKRVEGYVEYDSHPQWENAAFMRVNVDDHFCNARILKMANTRIMNSYIKGRCRWQFGDFIVHFAGISNEDRKVLIPAFYEFVRITSKFNAERDIQLEYMGIGS
jgi:hypothetical protein